jgi:hypothetical protein
MGATVTTGKLASAFIGEDGKTYFVLFEQTYEKNCYPHTPRWSCCCIGTIETAMRQIFLQASSCEGGMLQNRNGHITPEGYIAGWLKELAAPMPYANKVIDLRVAEAIYVPIPSEKAEAACKVLVDCGRTDIAQALTAGRHVPLDLYRDAALLVALYGTGPVAPWHIIDGNTAPTRAERQRELGYAPPPAKGFASSIPKFLKVDRESRLIQRADGTWSYGGWEYSIVGHHICTLWETELRLPGSYRQCISSYRDALRAAPAMPDGMSVRVDLTVPLECKYQRETVARVGAKPAAVATPTGYEIAVRADDDAFMRDLMSLPDACSSWIVPQHGSTAAPAGGGQQLDLLAA